MKGPRHSLKSVSPSGKGSRRGDNFRNNLYQTTCGGLKSASLFRLALLNFLVQTESRVKLHHGPGLTLDLAGDFTSLLKTSTPIA